MSRGKGNLIRLQVERGVYDFTKVFDGEAFIIVRRPGLAHVGEIPSEQRL